MDRQAIRKSGATEMSVDRLLFPHEDQGRVIGFAQKLLGRGGNHAGTMVTTHGVEGDSQTLGQDGFTRGAKRPTQTWEDSGDRYSSFLYTTLRPR